MVVGLAAHLRAETRTLHTWVERSAFVSALLAGRLDRYSYALMLRNLEPIYFELEAALVRHATHAAVRPWFAPPLFRVQALHRDLEKLQGELWRDELELLRGCAAYVVRLRYLKEFEPELLVAHAYVRYLGDLSGGQRLAGIVLRSLDFPVRESTNCGVDFYDFGPPDQVLKLSRDFRIALDTLTGDGVPAEAKLAFEMHGQLFEELASRCGLPGAAVTARV
jgi:heme oxygenase (biliverdin-producing, ferredoxin)